MVVERGLAAKESLAQSAPLYTSGSLQLALASMSREPRMTSAISLLYPVTVMPFPVGSELVAGTQTRPRLRSSS
ncbi:hypothetical protein C8T65DRAFT_248678 [Cerioporus squamosus]|nr:hypothetical protein C8T65DRAFT_248678 [Cerioporus squamosus]